MLLKYPTRSHIYLISSQELQIQVCVMLWPMDTWPSNTMKIIHKLKDLEKKNNGLNKIVKWWIK